MDDRSNERPGWTRWLFIGALAFLAAQLFGGSLFGTKDEEQPLRGIIDQTPLPEGEAQLCSLKGARFEAELTSRGASLVHFRLTDEKYTLQGQPIDLVSTVSPSRLPLRTTLLAPDTTDPLVGDFDLVWKLASSTETECVFQAVRPGATVSKRVYVTGQPFQLGVELTVTNTGSAARGVRASIEHAAFRTVKSTEGSLGRTSEWMSETVAAGTAVERQMPSDFEPADFKEATFTSEKWRRAAGAGRFAATSSSYLTQVLLPGATGGATAAETQIEEAWNAAIPHASRASDPNYGHYYRSRLVWEPTELAAGASVRYEALAFLGPKERDVLAALGNDASETLNLGWFAPIAKLLIAYLYAVKGLVGSWGWAICLLTATVRILVFPLTFAQIRSTVQMRRLKPELDAITAKYQDDMAQRGLAMQELYRKHGMSQFDTLKGCFPMLLQMPVWFALYTSLQTAVELYHVPFGPFIPDLSAEGKYYIIPLVLGASSLIQQRLMPMQGDAAQARMMMYLMPVMFTVMMLFLPAGLGVYMLTNTWLGIGQQVMVERYLQSKTAGPADIEVKVKEAPRKGGGRKA